MATQLRDGTWTPTEPLDLALATLTREALADNARRFVIGTKEEVEAEKNRIAQEDAVDALTRRVDMLEARTDQSLLALPTAADVERITAKAEELAAEDWRQLEWPRQRST